MYHELYGKLKPNLNCRSAPPNPPSNLPAPMPEASLSVGQPIEGSYSTGKPAFAVVEIEGEEGGVASDMFAQSHPTPLLGPGSPAPRPALTVVVQEGAAQKTQTASRSLAPA